MDQKISFSPPRRNGLLFLGIISLLFMGGGGLSFYKMLRSEVGGFFFVYLMLGLIAFSIVAWTLYHWFALRSAFYSLERNGIRFHWGLRSEDIPMKSVSWVRSSQEVQQILHQRLPLPFAHIPGAIIGQRRLADGSLLDYLSSDTQHMVLIATDEKVYVISPSKQADFIFTIQRLMELGSMAPWKQRSQYPTIILLQVWQNRWARWLLIAGLIFSLGLIAWVSLTIPNMQEVYMTFSATEPAPPTYLLLLPLLNGLFYLLNSIFGLFFYRRALQFANPMAVSIASELQNFSKNYQFYAYLLWVSSLITGILFYFAISFITYVG